MNIVLIVIDSLRAKNLSIYGYDKDTAPFLTKMAKKNTYADKYYSNSPWTLPAHASIFTGALPSEHGVNSESLSFNGVNTLVAELKEKGYNVAGLSENVLLPPSWNFIEGRPLHFIDFLEKIENKSWYYRVKKVPWLLWYCLRDGDIASLRSGFRYLLEKLGLKNKENYNTPEYSKKIVEKAKQILNQEDKNFLFLNLMPVHYPYTFTETEKEKFLEKISPGRIMALTSKNTVPYQIEEEELTEEELRIREEAYNASIRYVDGLLEELWKETPEDTLFIVTSDHGELHGEYKRGVPLINHHMGTFKELLRVPLVVFPDSPLDFDSGKIYDHRSLHKAIIKLAGGDKDIDVGRKQTTAEYYSYAAINLSSVLSKTSESGLEIPKGFEELYKRKSFSQITKEWKYDYTTEGECLWRTDKFTEDKNLVSKKKEITEEMRKNLQTSLNMGLLRDIDI